MHAARCRQQTHMLPSDGASVMEDQLSNCNLRPRNLVSHFQAGAGGFEPPNIGSKGRCLTTWRRPNLVHSRDRCYSNIIEPATQPMSQSDPQWPAQWGYPDGTLEIRKP